MVEVTNRNAEPIEAFPYKKPPQEIKEKYAHIFKIDEPLSSRIFKTIFDKSVALVFLIISFPILLTLKVFYLIEGLLIPENRGPMFFFYWAISGGKKNKKMENKTNQKKIY